MEIKVARKGQSSLRSRFETTYKHALRRSKRQDSTRVEKEARYGRARVGRANLLFVFRSIIISALFFLPRPFELITHAVVTIHGNVSRGKRGKRPTRGTVRTVRFGRTNIQNPIVSDRLLADLTAFPIVVFEFVLH